MRQSILSVAITLTVSLMGCSSKELTRSKAADLITHYKDFDPNMAVKVAVGTLWWDWRMLDSFDNSYPFKALETGGLLTMRETGKKEGYWSKQYVVEPTATGADRIKTWTKTIEKLPGVTGRTDCYTTPGHREPCDEPVGTIYSVVLAKRKLNEVTGIAEIKELSATGVEFNWEWEPTADAKLFAGRVSAGVKKGEALLQLYDDGWRVERLNLNAN